MDWRGHWRHVRRCGARSREEKCRCSQDGDGGCGADSASWTSRPRPREGKGRAQSATPMENLDPGDRQGAPGARNAFVGSVPMTGKQRALLLFHTDEEVR